MSRVGSSQEKLNSQDSGRHSRQREASEKQKARENSHDSGQDDLNEPNKPNINDEYATLIIYLNFSFLIQIFRQPTKSVQNLDLIEAPEDNQTSNYI